MNTVEIALFPIPGSVSLPYSKVPLHVFEPRYRKMIKDCINDHRRIGVSHTKRVISEKKTKSHLSLEEHLNTNHESYEAYSIFSAGFAQILETLPDGRLLVQITMDSRYETVEEMQQVPYKIVLCREYKDHSLESKNSLLLKEMRMELDETFIKLSLQTPSAEEMSQYIKSDQWKMLSDEEYSFAIYSLILFESETMQKVLELTSPLERISFLRDTLLNSASRH